MDDWWMAEEVGRRKPDLLLCRLISGGDGQTPSIPVYCGLPSIDGQAGWREEMEIKIHPTNAITTWLATLDS